MKSTNQKRLLIVSSAVILLCLTLIVNMTFALFTDMRTVKNHLQAGDLAITLMRTKLEKTTLDKQGFLTEMPADETDVYFTESSSENVFNIETDEKIVPGTKYVATMELSNLSDVAFGYWIEIVCTNKKDGENLAKQLKVTVDTGKEQSARINDGLYVGASDSFIDEVGVGQMKTFTVTVEFIDEGFELKDGVLSSKNDVAQIENLEFDMVVYAIQAVQTQSQAPTNP